MITAMQTGGGAAKRERDDHGLDGTSENENWAKQTTQGGGHKLCNFRSSSACLQHDCHPSLPHQDGVWYDALGSEVRHITPRYH